MLYSLGQVLTNRPPLITVRHDAPMLDAVRLLIERRLGQLAVVDETGQLRGILSHQILMGLYHMTDGQVPLFDLTVADAMEPAQTLTPHDDLLAAVDLLRNRGNYAVIVVQEGRPVGTLTGKDMTHFFRSLFEGIILVERIETRLAEMIALAFPSPEALNEAGRQVFGTGPNNPAYSARHPDRFTFGDRVSLMSDDDIWPAFEPALGSRDVFMHLMDRTRRVRNALMHFRGNLSFSEQDALRKAHTWLEQRPPVTTAYTLVPKAEYSSAYTTGNNPLPSVTGRKLRTLPAGEAEAD